MLQMSKIHEDQAGYVYSPVSLFTECKRMNQQ